MSRSKRLRPIIELAEHREKEASRVMADAETRLAEHVRLLAEIERYHADYTRSSAMRDTDTIRLKDYRLFLDRIEQAIARQRELIVRLEDECRNHRDTWTSHRSHRKALDNAAARYAHAEADSAGKDEQRQLEEIAAILRLRSR